MRGALVPLLTAGFQFALPPIELAFLHVALPAKFPNRHPAPRCIPDRPLPIPLLLDIVILPVHPTPPPFRDTLSRAGHYCCLRFNGGRCGRTVLSLPFLFLLRPKKPAIDAQTHTRVGRETPENELH